MIMLLRTNRKLFQAQANKGGGIMRKGTVILSLLSLVLAVAPAVSTAGEKTSGVESTGWREIVSGIIGSYPIRGEDIGKNKTGFKDRLAVPKN